MIKEGIFLEATQVDANVGKETEAGAPNITGDFSLQTGFWYANGCFQKYNNTNTTYSGSFTQYDSYCVFDASLSSPVYGKSNTIQPHSIKAKVWKRIA